MDITTIRRLLFILTITIIGVACSDTGTGIDNQEEEPATVEGRVDDSDSGTDKSKLQGVEGAVITAARVTSEGNLQAIGGAETETNAQGEFTLNIDANAVANASDRIVIVAEQNGETTKAFVTSEVRSGATVGVQPLSFESSSEADVYQEVIANGDADLVTKADIEVAVAGEVAADIKGNASYAAEVAGALAARAEAKAEFYSEQAVEVTEEQKEEVKQIKADAQIELENKLNAGADSAAAVEAFVETMAKAELEAGINANAVAKSSESSFRVLMEKCATLSSKAQAEVRQRFAFMMTFALDTAVQAQLQATGASEATIDSAADAAVSLRTKIKAMTDATETAVKAAFSEYNSKIEALVSNDSHLKGELFVSANATINEEGGSKATLESELQGTLDLGLLINTYTQFYSSVESTVETAFSSASEAEIEAYSQLLILINVAS